MTASGSVVVDVYGVSKSFEFYAHPMDMLKEQLFGGVRHDVFWALKDVNLEVRENQRVGIIGPNGAGKSTLLKLITGNLEPTTGSVRVDGRISALLSMVPAWNPNETGIENIKYNLLVQGVPRVRIPSLIEDIVDFAELGAFIYRPVKTYSTGMGARLSFAVATAVEPEVLIIDEVLGTGDAYFAAKAEERMRRLCDRGKALIFVSHALAAVQRLCDTVVWMQGGGIRMQGAARDVMKAYQEDAREKEDRALRAHNAQRANTLKSYIPAESARDLPVHRVRLLSEGRQILHGDYYVRRIVIGGKLEVPLELVNIEASGFRAGLDLFESEWGRMYERGSIPCRTLAPVIGRAAGGHAVFELVDGIDWNQPVEFEIEYMAEHGAPPLVLEYADTATGLWATTEILESRNLERGWVALRCSCRLPNPDAQTQLRVRSMLEQTRRPLLHINDVRIEGNSGPTAAVTEREPFEIVVELEAQEDAPPFNVTLYIFRADGVHVHWHPSNWGVGPHQVGAGVWEVRFDYSENLFGAADYDLTVSVTAPWAVNGAPTIDVYDRRVNTSRFRVLREQSALGVGVINKRVLVSLARRAQGADRE